MSTEFDEYASSYSALLRDPVRDYFAGDTGFFHRRKWELIRGFLIQHAQDPAQLSWLDVGCGQGHLLHIAGKHFGRAVGCDPSQKMMSCCTSAEVYAQPSPVALPFETESFDFVTAACVFHHVHGSDRTRLTASIRRILKPGGIFCIIEHNPCNPITRLIVRRCPIDSDAELLGPRLASRLMCSAGLEVLDVLYFLYFPESLFHAFGAFESLLRYWPLGGQYAIFGRRSPVE
jgi:SAM-dependent methyltransferase